MGTPVFILGFALFVWANVSGLRKSSRGELKRSVDGMEETYAYMGGILLMILSLFLGF